MRFLKGLGYFFLIWLVAFLFLFGEDPWLWRRYASILSGNYDLSPTETVTGGEGYDFLRADDMNRTISIDAIREAESYAANFDSHALIVLHKGSIQTEWYADGWDSESLTQSQSMHKTFMGVLIGRAIYEGFIGGIDDPISKYIPEWADDPRGDITIEQLMTMSSGLAQYKFGFNPFKDDFQWLYSGYAREAVLRTPMADWEPGTQFDYNNVNSELLGLIIERSSGMRYSDYLSNAIWKGIGAKDAQVWLERGDGAAHTSCCFMARAIDWARFGQMMLRKGEFNGNRIMLEAWHNLMISPSAVSKWYGYQTWLGYEERTFPPLSVDSEEVNTEPFLARDTYYLSGRGGQHVFIVPSQDLVVVRLGPALGPKPLKDGWQVSYLVNTLLMGLKDGSFMMAPEVTEEPTEEQVEPEVTPETSASGVILPKMKPSR